MARYDATKLAQQTALRRLLKLLGMEQQQSRQEDHEEMIKMNIKEFIEAARHYLFGMAPARQPALIPVVARRVR